MTRFYTSKTATSGGPVPYIPLKKREPNPSKNSYLNNRLILIGGKDKDSDVQSDIWAFDLMKGNERWYKMKFKGIDMPPLYGHTAIYDKRLSRIIIYGGMNDDTARLNTELFELSKNLEVWEEEQYLKLLNFFSKEY